MPALSEAQAAIMDALLGRSDARALALLRAGTLPVPRERLQIYRNNRFENLHAALGAVYPVVRRLVGDEFFRQTARVFIRAHPSRSGNLQDFGAELASFLRVFGPARTLPYLSDVAALEWACHEACHERELAPLEAAALARLSPAGQTEARFALQPSARFVSSRYDVLAIWQANQAQGEARALRLSLPEGGQHLLIVQHELQIEIRALARAERDWLQALADGHSLAEACEQALACDPAFDLAQRLTRHLAQGLFTGLMQAQSMRWLPS